MSKISLIAVCVWTTACSQQSGQPEAAVQGLPMRFALNCGRPGGSEIPDGAKDGFKILVDRQTSKFSLSWEQRPRPIANIRSDEITLVDEHIERGVDNNPEDRKITFDRQTGMLHFHEAYSALIPVNSEFSSHCKIGALA